MRPGRILVYVLLISAISLPVFLASCNGSTTIPETTKVLDEATLDCLSGASGNFSTLSFEHTTEQLSSLSVGDVIISGVSEIAPYGLLREVTNVVFNEGQVVVETNPATLEDAIQDCTIDTNWRLQSDGRFVPLETQEIAAGSMLYSELNNALASSAEALGTGFYLHFDDVVLFDGDGYPDTKDDQITADVSVDMNVDCNIGWIIRGFNLVEAHFQPTVNLISEVKLSCKVAVAEIHPKMEVYRQYLSPFTVMVGPFPVVVLPMLSLNIGLDGEVSAGITAGVTGNANLTAGVQYSNGDWSTITDFSTSFDWQGPALTAGCEVKAYVGPQLSFLLYGGAGPYIEARGYLELDADIFRTPWWELYGGLEADVGFKVEAMGHKIADYEKPLAIGYRVLLAQAGTPTPVTLTISSTVGGSVTTPGEGTYNYDEGTVVDLVATPDSGYRFVNWTGDVDTIADVDDASITITMNGDYYIIANFEEEGVEEPVYFADPNLEAAIREAISKPMGDIYPSDLTGLTSLSAYERNIADLTGLEYCASLTNLYLWSNEISDISPLNNLTNLTILDLAANQISDISPVDDLTNLTHLYLWGNQISNISPVENLTNLTVLYLNLNQINDISSLTSLTNLTGLELSYNQISDISPLANLTSLTGLGLSTNQINDISPLVDNAGLGEGDVVSLNENPLSDDSINIYIPELQARGVTVYYDEEEEPVYFPDPNLEAAIREAINKPTGDIYQSDLAGLTLIDASEKNISNLTGLEHCTDLKHLDLSWNNQISDISALANLNNLLDLHLGGNQISDISALANLNNLTTLYLYHNHQLSDISVLASLVNLRYLILSYDNISNISALANLTNLIHLNLRSNQISNVSPLANLTNLILLRLDSNQISDVAALANMTNLIQLDLHSNQISNVLPLTNLTSLKYLYVSYNKISDIAPLVSNPGLGQGDEVHLHDNPLNSDSINIYIPQLEARGVIVYY